MNNKLVFINDDGIEHDMCDPRPLLDEITELENRLGFAKLREKLHVRLIAAGNDELAARGTKIETLLRLITADTAKLEQYEERMAELQQEINCARGFD